MPRNRSASVEWAALRALGVALVIAAVAVGLAHAIGGRGAAIAALIASPLILGPITLQVNRRLREGDGKSLGCESTPQGRRRKMQLIATVFLVAGGLGAIGADLPGHPNQGWLYGLTVVVGALWAAIAAFVTTR